MGVSGIKHGLAVMQEIVQSTVLWLRSLCHFTFLTLHLGIKLVLLCQRFSVYEILLDKVSSPPRVCIISQGFPLLFCTDDAATQHSLSGLFFSMLRVLPTDHVSFQSYLCHHMKGSVLPKIMLPQHQGSLHS